VLDHATGVIVHSAYSRALADSWYGKSDAILWRNIPLIRGIQGKSIGRKAAREKLGFSETDFVVCSFGMMQLTKCNEHLLDAWLNSLLASEINCHLVFVGESDHGAYGEKILEKIALHQAGKHITITGFVTHDDYCCYLSAADLAVQLRTRSRGESSASVLDCLLYGLATIVNSHGAVAELPDDILLKLDDQFSLEQLSDALNALWQNASLRGQLSQRASAYIETHHAPLQVGKLYYDAIEFFDKSSPKQHYKNLLKSVSRIGVPDKHDLAKAAIAIAANQPPTGMRQLLVDISVMVQFDHRTGIQRVVRSILSGLIDNPPCGYRIEPVYSPGGGEPYRYAHRYAQDWLQCAIPGSDDAIIEVCAGDIFLGLDLFLSGTQQNEALLQLYKNRGVKIYFVVYDILPVLRPDVFPEGTDTDFSGWLQMITRLSHGLVCISKAVSDELSSWIEKQCPQQNNNLTIDYFHLGADINASQPSLGLSADAVHVLDIVRSRPSLIMVGTLEPRKGHAQVLAAFDLLWAEGIEINLVIVGKNGWMVDELVERLQSHPENGQHLLWPENVSDEMLLQLYEASTGLLAASEGEGFGLPLIEAAQHKLPIIARKLPVFMEVMGEHAFYFDGLEPETLADALRDWLQLLNKNKIPQSDGMPWLTWEESAQQLLDSVLQRDRNG
jgi:glycosyltransferase involved in cell wall biosynthesis